MNRFQVVATDPEQILNLTMDRQQSLGVGNRFESANLAFFLTGVLVGDLYLRRAKVTMSLHDFDPAQNPDFCSERSALACP